MKETPYKIARYKSKRFSKYVTCIKFYHFTNTDPIQLHPEGHLEIIFQLNNVFSNSTISTNGWKFRPNNFIGGLHTKSYWIKPNRVGDMLLSIQFKPNGAKHFVPEKLVVLKNQIVDLEDIYSTKDIITINSLCLSNSISKNLEIIDEFLASIFNYNADLRVDYGLKLIAASNGFLPISEVAKSVGFSEAQFRKKFNEEVGLSPSAYNKIVRINILNNFRENDINLNLTEIAYKMGYFDQSHFIKDVKAVTGMSPKQFLNIV